MGNRANEIHPPVAGNERAVAPRNTANYRITDADRLGEGSLRKKFEQNVAALELLFKVEHERRSATVEEKSVLVKYAGWGGLPQVFATEAEAPGWKDEQKRLKELLDAESYESARATVLNAHYTSPTVIRAMYAAVERLGFKHGRVLEPACGLGHFFGLMPPDMASRSELTGVEIDRVTARLTAMLYPDANIHVQPFEDATLPTNSFDLAISNVPFGDYAPFDAKLNRRKFKIHDYFFVSAQERVRPGGLIAFITTRGTMDKQYPFLREAVAAQCDLVGAVRLPITAFKKNANTEVTTDIIILRKRAEGEKPGGAAWQESRPWNAGGGKREAVGRAIATAFETNDVLRLLQEDSIARSGPFDGGCLIVAKALQIALDGGDLVRLTNSNHGGQTEHYGLRCFGGIFDGAGFHASEEEWMEAFTRKEKVKGQLFVHEGWDAETPIPDDAHVTKRLASLLRPHLEESLAPAETNEIFLNEYYHDRPAMMLGTLERTDHGMYGADEVRLAPDRRELSEALAYAVSALPENIYRPLTDAEASAQRQVIPVPPGVKPNAYVLTDHGGGGIAVREGDELRILTDLSPNTARRIRRLIHIRDAARECLRSQVEDRPEPELAAVRFKLNQVYDYFVGQFGAISQSANSRAFAGDPDLPLLLSLENYDEATGLAAKTAIFHERTIQRKVAVASAAGAKEALLVTLSEKGRVDLNHIERLLGKPEADFLPELQGAIYHNPVTKGWETDDEYLSGNVREKLAVAERVAREDPKYQANVEALRGVQPEDLKATDIDARLGAAWLPTEDIEEFGRTMLRAPGPNEVRVQHVPNLGLWTVEVSHYAKTGVANNQEWGTARVPAHELIEAALNLRTPTVYDYDEKKKPIVNAVATEAAREKQQKLKDRFADWIWENDERRERLVARYNRECNHTRLRTFRGEHLTLPGVSPTITLRAHQKAAVWRIVQTQNALLAHVVGAGKTYTMAAAAMELKRLGLARKPLFVVPNHMLGQFSTELLTLYPGAHVLVAGKDDFASARRRELMSRIATNNWDAVIVTHSGFERLPMSEGARKRFLEGQQEELEDCIREQKERSGKTSNSRMVKLLASAKKRLEGRIKKLSAEHRKDDTLTFEELGIDRIFVDEAQAYKNLFYTTKMTRVAGLPQAASERAFDLFLKTQHVQKQNGGGGIVFATGTPVTNTMAEMFTMQRYLGMVALQRRGLQHFDAWAGSHGETVTSMELAPDGAGYRLNTRFARFVNVPELMHMFRDFADVQTADMLKLPVPELEGGKPQIIRAPATPELKAFVQSLAKRAEKLKGGLVDPSVDNMLKITGEGRQAALDLRLMIRGAADHPDSKVNQAVRQIYKIWHETTDQRLTQLVFCDLSTPQAGGRRFSVYQDVRAKLVALGVPAEEIQFIQDHDSDAAKLSLFKDVRAGRVRILMGSTAKMGAGTNVQAKLVALHHMDAPWRPADIEQREGRIRRQGNTNAVVKIFRYVTEGSFDAYMWQVLEVKAKFISQIMSGETTARRIEDLDSPALTYAEVKAIASGNPLVVEKAKVDSEVMKLARLRAEHSENQFANRSRLRLFEEDVARMERRLAGAQRDLATRQDTHGDKFRMVLSGEVFTDRVKAGNALIYLVNEHGTDHLLGRPSPAVLGELAGFKLEFRSTLPDKLTLRGESEYGANVSVSPVGIISSLERAVQTIDDQVEGTRKELTRTKEDIAGLSKLVGGIWEHEEHYRAMVKRQTELVEALDLTKNQAAAQLATESEETETVASETPAEDLSEEVGAEAEGPSAAPQYYEDLSPEAQAAQRDRRRAELEAISGMKFPLAATFGGESVSILGPVARFSPYKEQARGKEDPYQLMVQRAEGKRFITMATDLQVDGAPLVTPGLPMREKRSVFDVLEAHTNQVVMLAKTKHRVETVQPPRESTPPALMTPGEAMEAATVTFSGRDAHARFGKRERWLSPGSRSKNRAIEGAHRGEIARALEAGEPVSAEAVAAYKIKLPEGYERTGDRYVSAGAIETAVDPLGPSVATTRVRTNAAKRRMAA